MRRSSVTHGGWLGCLFLLVMTVLGSCASHSQPEGDLLDNKVTAQRVQEALRRAGPEFRHIKVQASREGITLSGTVKSEKVRDSAAKTAQEVHRSMKLTNDLQIKE